MEELRATDAERILAVALNRPAGTELVFGALAEIPGVQVRSAQKRGFLRAGTPAQLTVDEWTFRPTGRGNAIEAAHTVRGVVLSRAAVSPSEAAAKLAAALLSAVQRQGAEAQDQAIAAIGALGEVLGL